MGIAGDFIFDDADWHIRYIVINTGAQNVLISTRWVNNIDWANQKICLDVSKYAIDTAPAYDASNEISREYEIVLHNHYEMPTYWSHGKR